jgi:hypothetical protein
MVEAFIIRLDAHANAATPRGFVGDFPIAAVAAAWDVDDDMVARMFAALEHPDVGWIDQDQVVSFWQRNPDKEDPTAAERMKRMRDRRRAEREAADEARAQLRAASRPQGVTRNTVTVTPRADLDHRQGKRLFEEEAGKIDAAVPASVDDGFHRSTGTSGENLSPELWLEIIGGPIVIERLQVDTKTALLRVMQWRRQLGEDSGALVDVIKAAYEANFVGDRFHNLITDSIRQYELRAKGPQLPFGPQLAAKRTG